MSHRIFTIVTAALLYAGGTQAVFAQTYDWINPSGGTYSTAGNWSPAGPPTASSTVRFNLANTYTVQFSAPATANTLTVNQGEATLSLNGNSFQLSNPTNGGIGASGQFATLHVFNGTLSLGNLSVGGSTGGTGSLILEAGSAVSIAANPAFIGTSGSGTLIIRNGGTLLTNGSSGLGLNDSGIGVVIITNSGSGWMVNNTLRVGDHGNGNLMILNGGTVSANALNVAQSPGGVGTVTLSGAGAMFSTAGTANIGGLTAGFPGASAVLNIGPGSTMNLNGVTNLRTSASVNVSGGTLNLNTVNIDSGAGFNWTAGRVNFADAATANAAMLDLLLSGSHTLGPNHTLSANAGTFNLDTSLAVNGGTIIMPEIEVNANLSVGSFATVNSADLLNINAGKTVQVEDFGTLGASSAILNSGVLQLKGSLATVSGFVQNVFGTVQGSGRLAGGMNIGTGGTVRLDAGDHLVIDQVGLTNSGSIELAGGIIEYTKTLSNLGSGVISGRGEFRGGTSTPGGVGLSNLGLMAFSGGFSDIHGDVVNSGAGRIVAAGNSTVTFFDDVTHNGAEIRTNAGSRTVFFGSVSGAGPFTGTGVVEMNGDLKPGNSPAAVSFGGDLELSATATLQIEIAGTIPGLRYDQLNIAGNAALGGGKLSVHLLNGYISLPGQSFNVMNFGSYSGDLTIDNQTGYAGLGFQKIYTANSLTLLASGIGGDANLDGMVDVSDLGILATNWQSGADWLGADFTGDGLVDVSDLGILATNWQVGVGSPLGPGSLEAALARVGLGGVSVPEPATVGAIGICLAGASCCRRAQRIRRRRSSMVCSFA